MEVAPSTPLSPVLFSLQPKADPIPLEERRRLTRGFDAERGRAGRGGILDLVQPGFKPTNPRHSPHRVLIRPPPFLSPPHLSLSIGSPFGTPQASRRSESLDK